MIHRQRDRAPVVITDAGRSSAEELRSRQRRYAILMAIHIAGFALAGALYYLTWWWLGVAVLAATGALPWLAVVMANDRAPGTERAAHLTRNESDARELDSREHITIDATGVTPTGSDSNNRS